MTENIEFISAKDLPEATGEEVSVLCVENGEMKQKPGASLGGSGGVLIVTLTTTDDSKFYPNKSYNEIKAAFDEGQLVIVNKSGLIYNLFAIDTMSALFSRTYLKMYNGVLTLYHDTCSIYSYIDYADLGQKSSALS